MTKGPGRMKTGAKKKKAAWRKGQSCVSNPTSKIHRLAAATSRFVPRHGARAGTSGRRHGGLQLTEKTLAQHNEATNDFRLSDDEANSTGGETYKTFLSGLSDCSNPAFEKVKRYWESNAASHKEVCAVLAAVTEVIREQGGNESETEYFAALMTSLDNVDTEESLSAILFLLSLIIKRVPVSVLRLKFSAITKTLLDILATRASSQSGTTSLRSCLVCLSATLRQQEYGVWTESSTLHVYHGILSYTLHQKPKIRKSAQHAVCAVLKGSCFMIADEAPAYHPAASPTAKFCVQKIEAGGGTSEVTTTMHALSLLKDIMPCLPQSSLKPACETILRLMTLSNVIMTSLCMQSLHGLFTAQPKAQSLPSELNAQLINALYDYQPRDTDVQPMQAWLAVMESALTNLARLDQKLSLSHLPRLFNAAIVCLASQRGEIAVSAAKVMKSLLHECVMPSRDWLATELTSSSTTPVHRVFRTIEGALSYKYNSSWGLVLQVLNAAFEAIGREGCHFMKKCLQSMCDLRGTHQFPFTHELDRAVGMAVRTMGPRFVLGAVPLGITGEEDNYDFPRSWLLPVLRDNIGGTELRFFTQYFLPLAAKLKTKAIECAEHGRNVEGKTYDVLQGQIWSLLPGFCKDPVDVCPAFRGVARILGSALADRTDLRCDVCAGIRLLVTRNMENEENRAELARFAKNFLPIFFNIYTSESSAEDRSLAPVLETVKVYLKITDPKLVISLFDKLAVKLADETTPNHHSLMDLAMALTPHLDSDHMDELFDIVTQLLKSSDRTTQKKAYRVLENLCDGSVESCRQFVSAHAADLPDTLVTSLSSAASASKGPCLRCLIHIVHALPCENQDFLEAILPDVILCTKEVNSKTRSAAFDLLVELGHAMVTWSDQESRGVCVQRYVRMLSAGLAGEPHMVSATVHSLTRVVFEFRDVVHGAFLAELTDSVCTLLRSKAREVLSSTLGFVKVLITILDDVTLAEHLKELISNIGRVSNNNRRNLRIPIRSIYTRFVRKYGYEMIYKMVPEDHKKMLHNIQKRQERTKRHKTATKEELDDVDDAGEAERQALVPGKPKPETIEELLQDSESDTEEDEGTNKGRHPKVKGRKKLQASRRGAAWLKEGQQEDAPLDFLDPSVYKRVLATKPDEKVAKPFSGVKHNFKTMPDGRLIIAEPEDEEDEKAGNKRKKRVVATSGETDELEELMDEELSKRKMNRKRKMEDFSDDEDETPTKYKAGGGGIHRPTAVAKRNAKEPGSEYKAKKAKGDIKKKSKHDPYAYVPLDRQQLNRRMKAKSAGTWKELAPKGKRGTKERKKAAKKR